ncbi:MAG: type II toxin-antitoxin system RelE/ParE family toxin [Candidatus Nealsonbacteria bacterium]|nr:type II toxin-antitoxin system RelE/ParE family toxin [Candidatus Nealsonbacteria bacterium]
MPRVLWTQLAESDLDGIHFYIGTTNHSQAAADRWIDSVRERSRIYAGQPEMGELRSKFGPGVRVFSFGNYVVFYRAIADGIEILRVLHGRRDYPTLFQ